LLPINNISYHFVKTVNGCTSEKVINTSITCKNFDDLLNDLKSKKEFVHKSKYSDIYITCSSLNKDLFTSLYLWHTDYVNSNKLYKLTLFDIIMHTNKTAEPNKEVKLVSTLNTTSNVSKNEPIKDIKPVNTLPSEPDKPVNTLPSEPDKTVNTLPKETMPISSRLHPEKMDMSDIFKILSRKLPINTEESEQPKTFNSKPDDDIIITTNNKTLTSKKPKSDEIFEKQLEKDQPEFKCFKVRFNPEDKPKIEEIPFKIPERKFVQKSEQNPERKLDQKPEQKYDNSNAEAFYEFLKGLSQMLNETKKKQEENQERKPDEKPDSKDLSSNPFMMDMPWTMRQPRQYDDLFMRLFNPISDNHNEEIDKMKQEKLAREKARIDQIEKEKIAQERKRIIKERAEKMRQQRAERIARKNIERENIEKKAQEKARKRARDPFMELFPFLI